MAEAQAQNRRDLSMFDAAARQRLQAMGFILYVPTEPFALGMPLHPFWDSALGRNIRRHAGAVDLAAIVLPPDPVRAKKSLWRAILAQRRPR